MKFVLLVLLSTGPIAFCQRPDTTASPVDLSGRTKGSYSLLTEAGFSLASTRMRAIRSFFRDNQIKPDSHIDPMVTLGFGGRYGRLKAMLQAGYGIQLRRSTDGLPTPLARQIDARYGGLLVGFDLANIQTKRLYVNVGLGSIGYEYLVYQRTNQVVAFQNLLQTSQSRTIPSLRLSHPYVDFTLEYTPRETRKAGVETVLRIGYRIGLHHQAWTSDAFQLVGMPRDRISQFYLQGAYSFSSNYMKRKK